MRASRTVQLRRRRVAVIGGLVSLLLIAAAVVWAAIARNADVPATDAAQTQDPPAATADPDPTPTETAPTETTAPEPTAEPVTAWDLDSPDSLTVIVNKQRPFTPLDWAPSDLVQPNVPNTNGQPLRQAAATAIEQMYAEANAAGVPFAILSAYRPYAMQVDLFNSYVAANGVAAAETFSARPGYSEHQTGLVVDITECVGCGLSESFGETPQGAWARDNAYRFGFVLRYNEGQESVSGYIFEPWHFRYVGVEVATDMHNRGIVNLEDYFGLPAAATY